MLAWSPVTVTSWCVPEGVGDGIPGNGVADSKLPASIASVEYRRSYESAVPSVPSFPVAVQPSRTLLDVNESTVRSAIAAGAVESGPCKARAMLSRPPLRTSDKAPAT